MPSRTDKHNFMMPQHAAGLEDMFREVDTRPQSRTGVVLEAATTNLGTIKQKPVNLDWWFPGCFQLMIWVGSATQGKGARQGKAARNASQGKQGKGKGP